jgi:alpha(1,3/1,4) fucosyltransferase
MAATKKIIRLDFCDLGVNFPKEDNFLCRLLRERFDVRLCSRPDFLIYSHDGDQHRLHDCVKIFYTVEAIRPDFRQCDYALTCFHIDDPRHLRFPHYVWDGRGEDLIKQPDEAARLLPQKQKFCAFIVSSPGPQERIKFFHKLSRYKQVDSGGRVLNNIGGPIPGIFQGKLEFLKPYKFNLAYENAALEGYTTEKLFEAMKARCVPIYWGNPRINEEFNPRSFLNRADFESDEALIERIRQIDQDDRLLADYLSQPYFPNNQPNEYFDHGRILDFFGRIFENREQPVSQRRRGFSFGRWTLLRRNRRHPWPPA